MTEIISPIPARLKNVAVDGHVAGTEDIIDDEKGKTQKQINGEVDEQLGEGGSVDQRIANTKSEILGDAGENYNTLGKLEDKIQEEVTNRGQQNYTKDETYNKTELNNLITTPSQEYVSVVATDQTTAVTDVLPAIGAANTTYRVGNWDGTQYNDSVFSEYAWNGSAYIKLSTKSQIEEVYDISANHADTKYADLAAALGTNGANIPQNLRKGGMLVKFVQSSDNKYVQHRYMRTSIANADFTNVNNWQGFSENEEYISDFSIGDEAGNDIVKFSGGHIKTKKFDSSKNATTEAAGLMSANDKTTLDSAVTKLNTIEENAEVNNTKTREDIINDFSISDESNNQIVQFKGGHIKTKEFDSSKNSISEEEKGKLSSIEEGAEVNNTETDIHDNADFAVSDELDNDIFRVSGGYPQTKNFNGYDIKTKLYSILSIDGNDDILLLNPKNLYDGLITASKGSRIGTTKNVVTFCHFTDVHAAANNIERMNKFNQRYADYIDDVVFSGDLVSNYGTEEIDYYTNLCPHALMCIGNHDSWVSGESEDTEQIYQTGGNFYILKQTYVYNKFIKPYVANWNVVQPSDAELEGKCYYYKDYIVSGATILRLIVLDVMHYGTVNDAIDSTHSKQDNWFVSVLEDARTNNIPVVVNCHYWGDYMDRLDCNYNEYDSTGVGVLGSGEISSIFRNKEGAARVQDFIDAGGEFICWITGHSHYDAIGTCRSYPNQLEICLTGAGAGRSGTKAQRRIAGTKSYDAFNYISFDTNDKLIKVIRVGYDVDRYYNTKRILVYRYKAFTDPITQIEHSVGLEVCK